MEAFWNGFEKKATDDKKVIMGHVKAFNRTPDSKQLGKARYVFKDGHHMMHISRGKGENAYFRHGGDGKLTMVLNG